MFYKPLLVQFSEVLIQHHILWQVCFLL